MPTVTANCSKPKLLLRPASLADLATLVALEERVFPTDRISRRSFRQFISSAHAAMVVAELAGGLAGYALVMFRRTSGIARLYSIAVFPELMRFGVGRALLAAAEDAALKRRCRALRLEVQEGNAAAARLYAYAGYRMFGRHLRYYQDGRTALRFEKALPSPGARRASRVI